MIDNITRPCVMLHFTLPQHGAKSSNPARLPICASWAQTTAKVILCPFIACCERKVQPS